MDPYATHLFPLVKTALETTGPILELGCGFYSTPILREICRSQGRQFLCQSSDESWMGKVGGEIEKVADWTVWTPPQASGGLWGMVFVDSEEGTWNRVKRVPMLSGFTHTIVLHDADISMERGGWPAAKLAFPNISIYQEHKPWTAVMRSEGTT